MKTWNDEAASIVDEMERWAERFDFTVTFESAYDSGQWWHLASMALMHLRRADQWDKAAFLTLLANKQRDYGVRNIDKFGQNGISIRLWDKIARLENLVKKGAAPRNESVVDTLSDIIGYVVISAMLNRGSFHLPLAAVEVSQEKDFWNNEVVVTSPGWLRDEVELAKRIGRNL